MTIGHHLHHSITTGHNCEAVDAKANEDSRLTETPKEGGVRDESIGLGIAKTGVAGGNNETADNYIAKVTGMDAARCRNPRCGYTHASVHNRRQGK